MPLRKIPVLPDDYDLFDWADWQDSRDALVSGGPTRYFAKEAWNAIVDELNEALVAAGLSWDATYTTAQGAKITVAYGALTARKFNSVRHNIDRHAPLGWAWADREDFRGYVGRVDFYGRETHGHECDKVYPEYIIELARKMNFLLEIMRGTAPTLETEASYKASMPFFVDAVAGEAALVKTTVTLALQVETKAIACRAANAKAEVELLAAVNAKADAGIGVAGSAEMEIGVAVNAAGRSMPAAAVAAQHAAEVRISAEGISHICKEGSGSVRMISKATAEAIAPLATQTSAEGCVGSSVHSELSLGNALESTSEAHSNTDMYAQVTTLEGSLTECVRRSATKISAMVQQDSRTALGRSDHLALTAVSCEFDSAWYPPIWVDGGLWIRQVCGATINESGELVIL